MGKKMSALLVGALLMMGMATAAHALTLTLKSGGFTKVIDDNGVDDLNFLKPGSIIYNGDINGIDISMATGTRSFSAALGEFDIASLIIQGKGDISINLSDSGLVMNTANFSPNLSVVQHLSESTGAATVTGNVKINGAVVPGIVASVTGTTGITTYGSATVTGPFSMEELISVNLGNAPETVSLDSFVTVAPVPEPGTMMLLGAGFLGLAIYGKRRKNA